MTNDKSDATYHGGDPGADPANEWDKTRSLQENVEQIAFAGKMHEGRVDWLAAPDPSKAIATLLGPVQPSLLDGVEVFMQRAGQLDWVRLPNNPKDSLRILRRKMLADVHEGEVGEYLGAEFDNDAVEIADGLLDVIIVAYGTLLQYFGPVLTKRMADEVTRSNMDKVGPDMVMRADGKVGKPKGWVAPNIKAILVEAGVIDENGALL